MCVVRALWATAKAGAGDWANQRIHGRNLSGLPSSTSWPKRVGACPMVASASLAPSSARGTECRVKAPGWAVTDQPWLQIGTPTSERANSLGARISASPSLRCQRQWVVVSKRRPRDEGEPNVGSWRTRHFEISGQPLPPPAARWVPKNVLAHNRKRAIGEWPHALGLKPTTHPRGFVKGAPVPLARGSSAFKCKPLVGAERRTPSHGV